MEDAARYAFVSYSRLDLAMVSSLVNRLRGDGRSLWYDIDLKPGDEWSRTVDRLLKASDLVVVILTSHSVESRPVLGEVQNAIEWEKRIIPVRMDDCDVPSFIAGIQRLDIARIGEVGVYQALVECLPISSAKEVQQEPGPERKEETGLWGQAPESRIEALKVQLLERIGVTGSVLWLMDGTQRLHKLFDCPPFPVDAMNVQLSAMKLTASRRLDRSAEILAQQDDASFFFALLSSLGLPATRGLVELIAVADSVTSVAVAGLKGALNVQRPGSMDPLLTPFVSAPSPSYPSRRAAVSAVRCVLMSRLFARSDRLNQLSSILQKITWRTTANLVISGSNYPVDVYVGLALGKRLGYALSAAAGRGMVLVQDDPDLDDIGRLALEPDIERARPGLLWPSDTNLKCEWWELLWERAEGELVGGS